MKGALPILLVAVGCSGDVARGVASDAALGEGAAATDAMRAETGMPLADASTDARDAAPAAPEASEVPATARCCAVAVHTDPTGQGDAAGPQTDAAGAHADAASAQADAAGQSDAAASRDAAGQGDAAGPQAAEGGICFTQYPIVQPCWDSDPTGPYARWSCSSGTCSNNGLSCAAGDTCVLQDLHCIGVVQNCDYPWSR